MKKRRWKKRPPKVDGVYQTLHEGTQGQYVARTRWEGDSWKDISYQDWPEAWRELPPPVLPLYVLVRLKGQSTPVPAEVVEADPNEWGVWVIVFGQRTMIGQAHFVTEDTWNRARKWGLERSKENRP